MKKVLLAALVAGSVYYMYNKNKKGDPENAGTVPDDAFPIPDSAPRELTDAEALSYLNSYPDLKAAYGNDIASAKWHWITTGYKENRIAY